MKTLYLKHTLTPLPPLDPDDQVLLFGEALYESWPVSAWGLAVDAQVRGVQPANVELIDYTEWTRRLSLFSRCITC